MSEHNYTDDRKPIDSTKTVVVAEDIHKAVKHMAIHREENITKVVDDILRNNERISLEIELQRRREELE
jgi:hypothetical protein